MAQDRRETASSSIGTTPTGPSGAVVLDCDPGHDDVVAIIVAAHTTDLVGVTTVAGNAGLERTTYNACVVRDLLGADFEIHAGAAHPLGGVLSDGATIHGVSGLGGAVLPEPRRGPDGDRASRYLIETSHRYRGLHIVATGPLTNVARAILDDDTLADRLTGIWLMGGGTFGNRTPVAEYNIWADPEAADIVFSSGVPITMVGLDITHRFIATAARIDRIRSIGGRLAELVADLFTEYSAVYRDRYLGFDGAAVHDPLAVLALSRPALIRTERRQIAIETFGALTRGMTVIDLRPVRASPATNVSLAVDIDVDAAWTVIDEAFERFSPES